MPGNLSGRSCRDFSTSGSPVRPSKAVFGVLGLSPLYRLIRMMRSSWMGICKHLVSLVVERYLNTLRVTLAAALALGAATAEFVGCQRRYDYLCELQNQGRSCSTKSWRRRWERFVPHRSSSERNGRRLPRGRRFKKGTSSSKLGKAEKKFVYRVEDGSTITRTNEEGSHFVKITIKLVDKEKCTANVKFTLKPGHKEFQFYSAALKQTAYYSSAAMESSDCRITN